MRAILIFLLAISSNTLQAQCADIYFYRLNNILLQSDKKVYLIHNGKTLAKVGLGERFKATICSSDEYEFVARMGSDDVFPARERINISNGQNQYLKIAATMIDVATINAVDPSKGRKEINKERKFTSELKTIRIRENPKAIATSARINTNPTSQNTTFQRSQTVNDFQFDVVNIKRMGDAIQFDYKITNLAGTDRYLSLSGRATMFYDEHGEFYSATNACLMKNCRSAGPLTKPTTSTANGRYHGGGGSIQTLIPSGIPVNANIRFTNIDKNATQFSRGDIVMRSTEKDKSNRFDFSLSYGPISFPTDIDPTNPNRRIIGNQSIELKSAIRKNKEIVLHFEMVNNSSDAYPFGVRHGVFYDNEGSEGRLDAISLVNQDQMKNIRYGDREISENSKLDFFLKASDAGTTAKQIRRTTITFKDFELSWEDINIDNLSVGGTLANPNTAPLNNSYINYSDFEKKVRNNEKVAGKKVVLENIYFDTGKDDLLPSSYPQLDRLADLMKNNILIRVEISGHTDDIGEALSNMLLSQERADAVRKYLILKSIHPSRISSVGKGEDEPIESNTLASGRSKNRRVEIAVKE